MRAVLSQFHPDIILASSTCPAPLLAVLQTFCESCALGASVRQVSGLSKAC